MKHVSKFDSCTYEISYSMSKENGKQYDDDITLIWRNSPTDPEETNGVDLPIMEMIGWYAGDYNYDDTEWYIKDWYRKKLEIKPAQKLEAMCLPIAYIHLIADCLDVIKKYKLHKLLEAYDGTDKMIDILQSNVDEVIDYTERIDVWADCDDILIAKEK